MSTTTPRRSATSPPQEQHSYSGFAVGLSVFAGVMMLMGGTLQAIQGLVALFNDEFVVFGQEYLFKFDITVWGWIHLVLGVVVALAGVALFQGATWARVVAVLVACVSIVANFIWMPYYPLWSLTIIALDVFIIWAVTAHGKDITVS